VRLSGGLLAGRERVVRVGLRDGRSCSRSRCRSGLGNLLQDRTTLLGSLIGAEDQGQGAEHEHDRAPSSGLGENVGGTARTEGRLAAGSAESAGQIGRFATLQQHDDYENQTIQNKKWFENPCTAPREAKARRYNPKADEQRDGPFHPSWRHFKTSHKFKENHDARLKPGLCKIDDRGERFGIQARSPYERPVQLFLRHQPLNIVRFDAAAIENP
jgi:hypothetical protein